MLKGRVVGTHVVGYGTTPWRQVLGELDLFAAQAHPHDPQARPEDPVKPLVSRAPDLGLRDRLEIQDLPEEARRLLDVRDREAHGRHRLNRRLAGAGRRAA